MTIDGIEQQTVNARDLHVFLNLGKDFSNWIKKRIDQYGFAEGVDFIKSEVINTSIDSKYNTSDSEDTIFSQNGEKLHSMRSSENLHQNRDNMADLSSNSLNATNIQYYNSQYYISDSKETIFRPNGRKLHFMHSSENLHCNGDKNTYSDEWLQRQADLFSDEVNLEYDEFKHKNKGGRPSIEYHITIDMAKELCMVERNAKGKEARKYFIECERIAKEKQKGSSAPSLGNLSKLQILEMAMESEKHKIALENKLKAAQPCIDFTNQVAISQGTITISQAAKILGTGRTRLFAFLRKIGWVTRRNEPYQSKIEQGLLDVKIGTWKHDDYGIQETVTTLLTGKGLTKLQAMWANRLF